MKTITAAGIGSGIGAIGYIADVPKPIAIAVAMIAIIVINVIRAISNRTGDPR